MSDPVRHARASELFLELRVLPPERREAELERRAASDAALRDEVRSLLAHDEPEDVALPERFGPYQVIARLGRGGSGQVFLAEQEEPVRRRVAVKVVPATRTDPELAARFLVERRALERTQHPGIARVLDAGTTEGGLAYLVMEHVDGPPITTYCERHALPARARVELLLEVAAAVEHAHRRGVIHRDLKPDNVLVREVDGRPAPCVLDFGIAKPIGSALGEGLPATSGLPVGTPAYMAPEQTRSGEVDTRVDVYALGALLHELIAGRPPIDAGGDPLEALRAIREHEPAPLRRALARSPGRLRAPRALLADLERVVAAALEKDPARRTPSVGALAEDLRRLLRGEPVLARPPTTTYRLARFAQRHRALVAAAAVVLAAVGVGVVGLALGLREAARERERALERGRELAEINRFLTDDLLASASPERGGAGATVAEVLRRAAALVDVRFAGRPRLAAGLHRTVGQAFAELGEHDDAEHHLGRALELHRASDGVGAPETVRSEIAVASLVLRRERLDEAERALDAAVARARAVLGSNDPDTLSALNDLGVALESLGRLPEARSALTEALTGRARLFGPNDTETLTTMGNLSLVLDGEGRSREALELQIEALRLAQGAPGDTRMLRLGLDNNVGVALQDQGRDAEAAPYLREAARLADELLGADHPATLTIRGNLASLEADLGDPRLGAEIHRELWARREETLGPAAPSTLTSRHGYWHCVWAAGDHEDAAQGFAELLAAVEASLGPDHTLSAQTRSSLARSLLDAGRPAEALPHAELAERRLRALYGAGSPWAEGAERTLTSARERLGR